MNMSMFRRIISRATAVAILMLSLSAWRLSAAAIVSDLTLSQVTWLNRDSSVLESKSVWGYLNFAYTPDLLSTNYLNVGLAQHGQTPVWLAQNVLLFTDDLAGRLGIDMDLSQIGINSGTQLSSADLVLTVDPTIRTTDPFGLATTLGVQELDWKGWDDDPVPGQAPDFPGSGRPAGTQITTPATPSGKDRDIRSQQEGDSECFLGATTRSLDWLNRTHFDLGLKNADGIYSDLKTLVAGQGEPRKIELKGNYASDKSGGTINTKIHDTAGFFTRGIPGVTVTEPADQSFSDWLLQQFATEDIELATYNGDLAHIMTVTRIYKTQSGKIMVRYRDDETQGNNATGDTEPKEKELYLKDGVWRFGGDSNKIYYGMAESVPEPATALTLGMALVLLLVVARSRFGRQGTV
jgi:hypothetical protein